MTSPTISSQPPSSHVASTPWHLAGSNAPTAAVLFDAIAGQSGWQTTRSDRMGGSEPNSNGGPIATGAAALARPAIALDNDSAGGHRSWPPAAGATPCRSKQPTPLARRPAAPLQPPRPAISATDILTAPLADIARWSAAGLLAQVPPSTAAADSRPTNNVPDQARVQAGMCPHARPRVHWATSTCEALGAGSGRPLTIQQQNSETTYLTGLPSPNASPACSPVASSHLNARMIHDPALTSIPMSPMSLLSPALPIPPLAAPVSRLAIHSTRAGHGVSGRVPQLAPASRRVQQPAQAIADPPTADPTPTIPIGIQTRIEAYPISPTPSSESASSVACSQPPSRPLNEPPPAAFVALVAGSPPTSASIRPRSVKEMSMASFSVSLKPAPKSFKSTRSSAAVPMQARSSPPTPQRAALPPNTRIVRDADGGVAFEFATPWSV